jgi:hypothetical protein
VSGRPLIKQDLEVKSDIEQHTFKLNRSAAGIYLLRISGKENTVTVKLINK